MTEDCLTGRESAEGYAGWDYCIGSERLPAENFTLPATDSPGSFIDEDQDWRVQTAVLLILAGYVWHLKNQATGEIESEGLVLPPPTAIPSNATLESEVPLDTPRPTATDVSAAKAVREQGLNPAALQALENLYATYCPSKLNQAPDLLSKYIGREDQLLRLVQAKYCPTSASFDPTLPTPR